MRILALILAGGRGRQLGALCQSRPKPALRFGGKYRLIDFCLSNIANSHIEQTAVLAQYQTAPLIEHLQGGEAWGLYGLEVWEPGKGRTELEAYRGTADAVWQNRRAVQTSGCELVLVLAADQVYRQDYAALVGYHQAKGAEVTIAAKPVTLEEVHRFGMMTVAADGKIESFNEKPQQLAYLPPGSLGSLGIYVFNTTTLLQALDEGAQRPDSMHDFGHDILPRLTAGGAAYAYSFNGYWVDIGTVPAYWQANMALLDDEPVVKLDDSSWQTRTRTTVLGPALVRGHGKVERSLLSEGCLIEGEVSRTVLSPGVRVEAGAVVRQSVVMDGVIIRRGAVVERCVVDEGAEVGPQAHPGPEEDVGGIGVIGR